MRLKRTGENAIALGADGRGMGYRRAGVVLLGLALADLALLHVLPAPRLVATTGAVAPYRPWNFLSEYARTQYAPLMIAFFGLVACSTLATAVALRSLRREASLLAAAGVALALLGVFPTDLADLSTDAVTCGLPGRIEPCTLVGRIHNPLSTVVFVPIVLAALCFCVRSRTESEWRGVARLAVGCGAMAVCGIVAATVYMHAIGWHGRWWTGLMQRSIVLPALLWMAGLLRAATSNGAPVSGQPSSSGRTGDGPAYMSAGRATAKRNRADRTRRSARFEAMERSVGLRGASAATQP
jgi:hypothetical membrane protein